MCVSRTPATVYIVLCVDLGVALYIHVVGWVWFRASDVSSGELPRHSILATTVLSVVVHETCIGCVQLGIKSTYTRST